MPSATVTVYTLMAMSITVGVAYVFIGLPALPGTSQPDRSHARRQRVAAFSKKSPPPALTFAG
jgi:hypothetical protein